MEQIFLTYAILGVLLCCIGATILEMKSSYYFSLILIALYFLGMIIVYSFTKNRGEKFEKQLIFNTIIVLAN